MTGEYFAFSIAQKGWYKEFMFPLLAFFRRGDFATQFYSVYTIVVCVFAVFAWRRFSLSFNLFIWISLLFPLTSGSITSMQRYVIIVFPLTIYLGEILYRTKVKNTFLVVFFLLQLLQFYFWLDNSPFSY